MDIKKDRLTSNYSFRSKDCSSKNTQAEQLSNSVENNALPSSAYGNYNKVSFRGNPKVEKFVEPLKDTETIKDVTLDDEPYTVKSYTKDGTEYIVTDDDKLYRIRYSKNEDKNSQTVLASRLYNLAGVKTPEMKVFDSKGMHGIASEYMDGLATINGDEALAYDGFGADAWLGNWNTFNHGNTAVKDGELLKLTTSGTLEYRASGKKKDEFSDTVTELETLRNPDKNPEGARILENMTDENLKKSLEKVANINKNDIILAVKTARLENEQKMIDTLLARQEDIKSELEKLNTPKPEIKVEDKAPVQEEEPPVQVEEPVEVESPVEVEEPKVEVEPPEVRQRKHQQMENYLKGEYGLFKNPESQSHMYFRERELANIEEVRKSLQDDPERRKVFEDILDIDFWGFSHERNLHYGHELHKFLRYDTERLKPISKLASEKKMGYASPLNEIDDYKKLDEIPTEKLDYMVNEMGLVTVDEIFEKRKASLEDMKYCKNLSKKYKMEQRVANDIILYASDENGSIPEYKKQIIEKFIGDEFYTTHYGSYSSNEPVCNLSTILKKCDTKEKADKFLKEILPEYQARYGEHNKGFRYDAPVLLVDDLDKDFTFSKIDTAKKIFGFSTDNWEYEGKLKYIDSQEALDLLNDYLDVGLSGHLAWDTFYGSKVYGEFNYDSINFAKDIAKKGFNTHEDLFRELFYRFTVAHQRKDVDEEKAIYSDIDKILERDLLSLKINQIGDIDSDGYNMSLTSGDYRYLSKKEIMALTKVDDKTLQRAKDLLIIPDKKSGHFKVDEIIKLAELDDENWERLEKFDLFKSDFNGLEVYQLAFLSDEELIEMKDKGLLKPLDIRHNSEIYSRADECMILNSLDKHDFTTIKNRNLFNKEFINPLDSSKTVKPSLDEILRLKDIDDKEYEYLQKSGMFDNYKLPQIFLYEDMKDLKDIDSIDKLSNDQKRGLMKTLIKNNSNLYTEEIQNMTPAPQFTPKNQEEYCGLMKNLVDSIGLKTNPISDEVKARFSETLNKLESPYSEFMNTDFTKEGLKLDLRYSREQFLKDVDEQLSGLTEDERTQVTSYFGFEYKLGADGFRKLKGYPVAHQDKENRLDPKLAVVAQNLKPIIVEFTTEYNKIQANEDISPELAKELNGLKDAFPELNTIIGKTQHKTHDYTVDLHTLNVLQNVMKNPKYKYLPEKDRRILQISILFHDLTKLENNPLNTGKPDKTHPSLSAYDAYHLTRKLGISKADRLQIYQIIKNHDFLEKYSPARAKDYAFELKAGNNLKMESILTEADLKSVDRKGTFYNKYSKKLDYAEKEVSKLVEQIQSTSIPLPQSKIPKASELVTDGYNVRDVVTTDSNGNQIKNRVINLKSNMDLSQYGFAEGLNSNDLNVLVHGLDKDVNSVNFQALGEQDSDALLSTSYVNYGKGNYHVFRQQGFVLDVDADDIHAAYFCDFGSGCGKSLHTLKTQYLFNGFNSQYRKYISDIIKKEMNLSDEEYKKVYEDIKDKSINQLDKEYPKIAIAYRNIINNMEEGKRGFGRQYNEILVSRPKIQAVFCQSEKYGQNYGSGIDELPEYLRKYAEEHDVPIIYFGE